MPKFAVYYIPEVDKANSKYFKFYRLGALRFLTLQPSHGSRPGR
jgi:hypothetical protein